MAFSKKDNSKEIAIVCTHPWHPGDEYTFYLQKRLPQSAIDAEANFIGLKDTERPDAYRVAIIATVAEMVTKEPDGFSDFPSETIMPGSIGTKPLAQRMREYFDDPAVPELEQIVVTLWRQYRSAAIPQAYLKSAENSRPPSGLLPQGPRQPPS